MRYKKTDGAGHVLMSMEDTSEKERLAELNRERVNRHREKVKGNGLVRVEVHIKPEFRTLLRAYVKGMK
jgi:hypothetical protein